MNKIKLDDWSKFNDEMTAFMLGIDDAVEKTIIRFLYDKARWVSFQELKNYSMDQTAICLNQSTLSRRLTSLCNFKILERRTEHDNKTFYKLNDNFIKELTANKEGFY
jgi:DNA-binding HxlR family transcriptional regulator